MREGGLEQLGTPLEVYYHPRNLFVAKFAGDANVLAGTRAEDGAETALGRLAIEEPGAEAAPGAGLDVVLRPEQISLGPPEAAGADRRGRIVKQRVLRSRSIGSGSAGFGPRSWMRGCATRGRGRRRRRSR